MNGTDWYGLGAFVASVCTGIAVVLGAATTTIIALLKWKADTEAAARAAAALAENTTLTREKGEQAAAAALAAKDAAAEAKHVTTAIAAKVEEVARTANGLTNRLIEATANAAHAAGVKEEHERKGHS